MEARTAMQGRFKAARKRVFREAEQIARKLKSGQTIQEVYQDYREISLATFHRHAREAIGDAWTTLVHPGVRAGSSKRVGFSQAPEAIKLTTGPHCWECTMSLPPGTLKCPNCGALQYG